MDDTHWNCYTHCIYLSLNTLGHQGAGLIFYWIRNNNFNFSLTLLDEHLDELNECFYEHSYEHLYEHSYMSIHKNIHINIHSAPTMVCICGKSSNSDFLGQTGQKKVCIYTKKSEFYHFPFFPCLFYINKLLQKLYDCNK